VKWIESAGGPLAAICESQASLWSALREEYTDACSVNDVGVITTSGDGGGPADVLVVCGEPLATSFSDELQLIVHWQYSENEELLMDLVHGNVRDLEWNPGGSFESKGSSRAI
jgi:hypothetical protein